MASVATSITPPAAGSDPQGSQPASAQRVGQVSEGLRRWRKTKSAIVSGVCLVCAVLVVTPLALVFSYLVFKERVR